MKRLLFQLGLTLILLTLTVLPAAASDLAQGKAPAGPAGKVAIMTSPGGDILLLDVAAGKTQRLTDGMDPAFSPDGSKLAFTRWGVEPGLFARDMKTGEERRIVRADKPRHPSWSADGEKLAFVRLLQTVSCRESVLGCLPEEQLRLLFGGKDCGKTPAGELCISSMPIFKIDQTGIATIGLNDQTWQDMPAPLDAQSVSWRPKSDDLLFRGNNRLQITGPGRAPVDVTKDVWWGSPIWSPDGARFLAQQRIHDHTDLALFDASGRLLQYLTKPPSAVRRSPNNVAPAWSPDGKTILFLTDRDGGPGVWTLYRMNADGSGQAPFLPKAMKDVTIKYDFAAERVISWTK
jgi:Tol biopolymer transport system component